MKRTVLSVFCLALVLCIVLGSCGGGGSSVIEDVTGAQSGTNIVTQQQTTEQPVMTQPHPDVEITTVAQVDIQKVDPLEAMGSEAKIFKSGKVYFEGTIYSEDSDEGMPVSLACDGESIQIDVSTSGITLGICVIDNVTYLLAPGSDGASGSYIEVSQRVLSALGLDNFDLTSITNLTQDGINDDSTAATMSEVTINGESGYCTEFTSDTSEYITKLYTVGDRLVQCDSIDKQSGKTTMQIAFTSVSTEIPSNMLSLNSYQKASSAFSFIRTLMDV